MLVWGRLEGSRCIDLALDVLPLVPSWGWGGPAPNGLEVSRPASQGQYRAKAIDLAGRVGRRSPALSGYFAKRSGGGSSELLGAVKNRRGVARVDETGVGHG